MKLKLIGLFALTVFITAFFYTLRRQWKNCEGERAFLTIHTIVFTEI